MVEFIIFIALLATIPPPSPLVPRTIFPLMVEFLIVVVASGTFPLERAAKIPPP
jgi:hypothetical protein